MKRVSLTELKTRTVRTLSEAEKEPVTIEKNGRPIAVIVPLEDYERLTSLDNEYWLTRAKEAEKSGYIGTSNTAAFLNEMLSQPNMKVE